MTPNAKRIPADGPAPWGVYDTVDDCWLGPADGPAFVFHDRQAVVMLCRRITDRHRFPAGRVVPRTYDPEARHLKDAIRAPGHGSDQAPMLRIVE
jgi:hypothetical protein